MKLFRISFNFDYAFADVVEAYDGADSLSLNSENPKILSEFRYGWITEDSTIIPDIAIIMSELFCLNSETVSDLNFYISALGKTEISIGKEKYYSLSSIPVLKNALNLKSSKIKYFSTGDIMEVSKPVFNERDYPNFFKVDEIGSTFFCSESFRAAIMKNNLTGLIFEECKIKSKSWFKI